MSAPARRPRILLADDHPILLEGLKRLLADEFDIVGVVGDGHALLAAARAERPDVIVADIEMPGLGGIAATERLRAENPATRVVILTIHHELAYARRALAAGAAAFVLKVAAPAELVAAIRAALAGRTYVSAAIAVELEGGSRARGDRPGGSEPTLTVRQREILQLLAEGKTTKEIGAILGISARTVEAHKYDLMRSEGLATGADLVRLAIRLGLIAP